MAIIAAAIVMVAAAAPITQTLPPFDPKDDLALIRGNITKPRPDQPTPEQNFYNNDLGGANIHLRAVMNNPVVRGPLLQYLSLYNFLQPNRNLAVAMLQTIFDGGEVDIVNRVLLDPSFTENPCLNGIYTDLGKAPTFQNYLNNFDGDFSVANLKLSAGDVDGHAVTNFPNNYLIEIKFDTGILSEVPTLDVVGTFIHEMIHAEIFRKLMSVAGTGSLQYNNWTPSQWKTYLETMKNDFPGLYDYYLRYESNVAVDGVLNEFQHQMMAQHYRDIIIDVLKEGTFID